MTELLEIDILYEDDDLLVVNKPSGLLSESNGGTEESMLDRVTRYIGRRAIGYHRIDRHTSGCLIFGKTARFNKQIARIFQEKKIRKEYWALVVGEWPKGRNRVETFIGPCGGGRFANVDATIGKKSITTFRVLARLEGMTWMQCLPKTGRTHQIRLHCLAAGCAILGDEVYGSPANVSLALHARSIQMPHPSGEGRLSVSADSPSDWQGLVDTNARY